MQNKQTNNQTTKSKRNLEGWFSGNDVTQKRSEMRELFRKIEGSYKLKHAAKNATPAPESSDEDAVIIEPKKPAEQKEKKEKVQPRQPPPKVVQKRTLITSPASKIEKIAQEKRTPSLIDFEGLVSDSKGSPQQKPKPIQPQNVKGLLQNAARLPNTC